MTRRAKPTPSSHPPRHVLDRAADGDRHALDYRGEPMPSVRSLLLIRPDGFTVWDVDALLGEPASAPPARLPTPSAAGSHAGTQRRRRGDRGQ